MPITNIEPSKDNPRKLTIENTRELAESLKTVGMLHPIICVRLKGSKYRIVAGHRRWFAAKAAGIKTVPVRVLPNNEYAESAIRITENQQRVDLDPFAEGDLITAFLAQGWTLIDIARDLGKSVPAVVRRANLSKMHGPLRKILTTASWASALHPTVLERIARMPLSWQKLESDTIVGTNSTMPHYYSSILGFDEATNSDLLRLKKAPFKMKDETLVPKAGSCLECTKRSGQRPGLFDDLIQGDATRLAPDDVCLDPPCWEKKTHAVALQRLKLADGEKRVVAVGGGHDHGDSLDLAKRAGVAHHDTWDAPVCKKSDPGAVRGVIADGPDRGKQVYVKPIKDKSAKAPKASVAGPGQKTQAEKDAALENRRLSVAIEKVGAILEDMDARDIQECAADEGEALCWVLAFGMPSESEQEDPREFFQHIVKQKEDIVTDTAMMHVSKQWASFLTLAGAGTVTKRDRDDAEWIAQIIGCDFKAMVREAVSELPRPKSWPPQTAVKASGSQKPAAKAPKKKKRATGGKK